MGGGDIRPAPGAGGAKLSAAEVRHGEQVEQGGAEGEAEEKASTAPGIALPFMAFSIVVSASTFCARPPPPSRGMAA